MGSSRGHGEYGRSYSLAATIQICMGCSVTRQWLSFGCTWTFLPNHAMFFESAGIEVLWFTVDYFITLGSADSSLPLIATLLWEDLCLLRGPRGLFSGFLAVLEMYFLLPGDPEERKEQIAWQTSCTIAREAYPPSWSPVCETPWAALAEASCRLDSACFCPLAPDQTAEGQSIRIIATESQERIRKVNTKLLLPDTCMQWRHCKLRMTNWLLLRRRQDRLACWQDRCPPILT
eukprot:s4591_g1.t2